MKTIVPVYTPANPSIPGGPGPFASNHLFPSPKPAPRPTR